MQPVNELYKSFEPHEILEDYKNSFILKYNMNNAEKLIFIFLMFFFTPANIVIAIFEIILIKTEVLSSELSFIPILHILLILFPLWLIKDMSPTLLSYDGKNLKLQKKILYIKFSKTLIDIDNIEELKAYFSNYKGNFKIEIKFFDKYGKAKLLFRSIIKDKYEGISIANFFSMKLNKTISA